MMMKADLKEYCKFCRGLLSDEEKFYHSSCFQSIKENEDLFIHVDDQIWLKDEYEKFKRLKNLENTNLEFEISSIEKIITLNEIFIRKEKIGSLPDIFDFKYLTKVNIIDESSSFSLPKSVFNSYSLTSLFFTCYNAKSINIPNLFNNLGKLETFFIDCLNGDVSNIDSIFSLENIKQIEIRCNKLSFSFNSINLINIEVLKIGTLDLDKISTQKLIEKLTKFRKIKFVKFWILADFRPENFSYPDSWIFHINDDIPVPQEFF